MKRTLLIKNIIQAIVLVTVCFWIFTMKIGTVVTGSMIPTIEVGESVLYCKVYPYSQLEVGDIIVYQTKTTLPVVHRIHSIQYNFETDTTVRQLRTKGDNNLSVDNMLITEDIYAGKVLCIIKNEKINTFIQTLANMNELIRMIIALLIIFAWIVGTELTVRIRAKKEYVAEDSDNTQMFIKGDSSIIEKQEDKKDEQEDDDFD